MDLEEKGIGGSSPVGMLYQVKDASVFLGILYAISFLIMVPLYIKYFDQSPTIIAISIIGLLSIVVVHFLFNWMYYVIISIPLLMSGVLFALGWGLYVFAPLEIALLSFTMELVNSFISIFGTSGMPTSWLSYINSFLEHLGQFFIAIGAVMWWLVQKSGQIRYKALAIYLVFLAVLGAFLGLGGLQNVIIFLVIWLLFYLKVSNEYLNAGLKSEKDLKGIRYLFKLAASVVIISGITGVHLMGEGLSASLVFSYNGDTSTFFKVYQDIILAFGLLGIWNPSLVKKWVPKLVATRLESLWELLKSRSSFIRI